MGQLSQHIHKTSTVNLTSTTMSAPPQEYAAVPVDGNAAPAPVHTGAPIAEPTAESGHAAHVPAGMSAKDAKNMTKILNKEEKHEDKTIKSQVKEISKVQKLEHKAEKADEQAIKRHEKAVSAQHEANKELERAQAKHEKALREAQKTENEIHLKQEHHGKVAESLQGAKHHLDELTHARESHHAEREAKLKELDAIANSGK